jgi:hypothetical protein|tara:strand:+ start:245 stop:490 length:246 start_codon:yes stop_codon:yes gene_type:complete
MKKSDIKQQQPQIDLGKTTAVPNDSGGKLFQQGFILRKVSRFITQGTEDAVMPIPVFYDEKTGKILKDTLPPELRDEYDTI